MTPQDAALVAMVLGFITAAVLDREGVRIDDVDASQGEILLRVPGLGRYRVKITKED